MKILSIGGTRPQFVKMAVLVKAIEEYNREHQGAIEHRLLHTGQHSDPMMSAVFFQELGLPKPRLLESVRMGTPGIQTALMLAGVDGKVVRGAVQIGAGIGQIGRILSGEIEKRLLNDILRLRRPPSEGTSHKRQQLRTVERIQLPQGRPLGL